MYYNVSAMYNLERELPVNVVHYYLNNGLSLRKTAQIYNIHYQTLFKWVKLYKTGKRERLSSHYQRPWNRTEKDLEEKIAFLKEKKPDLTVRKAKEMLEKQKELHEYNVVTEDTNVNYRKSLFFLIIYSSSAQ